MLNFRRLSVSQQKRRNKQGDGRNVKRRRLHSFNNESEDLEDQEITFDEVLNCIFFLKFFSEH